MKFTTDEKIAIKQAIAVRKRDLLNRITYTDDIPQADKDQCKKEFDILTEAYIKF